MFTVALPALTMDNLDGDYFVVGAQLLEGATSPWREIQAWNLCSNLSDMVFNPL